MENEFHMVERLLEKARSIRRYDGSRSLSPAQLRRLVGLARLCPSGRNIQALRYRMVTGKEECARLFPLLAWAGYLTDWDGPAEGERPAAYLVQMLDTRLTRDPLCDDGLQLQAITMGAVAMGFGSCILKAFDPARVKALLGVPGHLEPRYVMALGYPAENVVVEDIAGEDYKYYRTPDGVHHVPKRSVDELLV